MEHRIVTASAYLIVDGQFLFMLGPTPAGEGLAVVRLGGHRETGESGPVCALREIQEEAALQAELLTPPATYWVDYQSGGLRMERGSWPGAPTEIAPLLVLRRSKGSSLSVTYLAMAQGEPAPSAEAKGLLLLSPDWVRRLTREQITLGQFLGAGGRAMLRQPFDLALPLLPFPQLQLLPGLLERHPDLGRPGGG